MTALFSKRLSSAEQNYTANDRQHLVRNRFLQSVRCYHEYSQFEIATNDKVGEYFFENSKLDRRKVRLFEMLEDFGIFHVIVKTENTHVLGDEVYGVPSN